MLPKPLAFRDIGHIKFQIFLIAFLDIFCQQVDILCILFIALFRYMWAFKASYTLLLQPKCRWCEFSSSCCAYPVWTFRAQEIINMICLYCKRPAVSKFEIFSSKAYFTRHLSATTCCNATIDSYGPLKL